MNSFMSISDVRSNLPTLVENVHKYDNRVLVTVNGEPKAALVSLDELESLDETVEILAIPGAKKIINQGEKEMQKGKGKSLQELVKK